MPNHTEKQFRNNATTPVVVTAIACANLEGIVTAVHAGGGIAGLDDAQRAEQSRMWAWIRRTFVGQAQFFFNAHTGLVPAPIPGVTIVNTINAHDIAGAMGADAARRIAERVTRSIVDSCRRPLYTKECPVRFTGMPQELGAGYENVSRKRFFDAPTLGTYWRQKSRDKDYQVIGVSEHENYVTVRMRRTTNDGVFEFPFHSKELWLHEFEQCENSEGDIYSAQRVSLEALRPERRYFIVPPGAGKTDVEAIMKAYRSTYPDFTEFAQRQMARAMGAVEAQGKELPPAEGERYQSLIRGRNIYRVLDARRKLNSEDWYITMIRECDGHKAKFTYRDHATWFLVWVPVIDEEEPVRKGNVTVTLDTSAASEALKKVGESMHEAAAEFVKYMDSDGSLHDLVRIMDELHKRVPGWNQNATPGPELDEASLAIRAIRTLAKRSQTATDNWQRAEDKVAELLKAKNHFQQRVTVLESQRRILPAVGSVWRTNSTGTYATVTHVFAESGMAKMRSAKGAEYDLPLDRLFEYSTLATGPATLLGAIGEVQCNAYGMTQEETKLKDVMAGSVFHIRELQHSSTGDVTVSGFITAKKPKED